MSVFVFEWTRTVISQQYLDSMSLDSHADRNNVIKEMALTAKVKVEWNSNGQVFLEGTWQHIMKIHIMLAKYLKLPGEVNDEDESDEAASPPCGKSMSTSMPSSPVPKVDAKTVLRYIRQKYLNASRRKNEQFHQRNLPVQSKKVVPEVEQTDVAGNSDREVKQENEVYVNITMSGSLDNLPGLLLPVASSGHDLEQLPYEGSLPESDQLLNTGDLLVQHKGTLINKNILVDDIKSESHITVVDNSSGQTVCHYELPDNSIIETCQRSNAIDMGREFLEENVDGMKNLVAHTVHGSADVGRIVWHSDDIHSFQNQVANRNESTKSSDNVYPLSCEPADCTNGVKEEIDIQNVSRSCGKKKDYEKLAPFKFFCTLCSFKSKRESHYQRHLELHSKVSELFSCKKCDFTTIRLGHLRRHEMSHSDTKFACDMCHYHTDHHKFLLRHQRIKHANVQGHENIARKELLRCVECAYSTTRPFFYKRHLQAHTSADSSLLREEHRFQCQQCSYKTGRKEHYIRHVNNVHNNKRPYLCDHCGKAFKRPDALKQHRVTHVELDPSLGAFCCPACGKCCRAQAQLTQHLAVHSNVRSFLCEICGSAFKTRAVQRKHVLTIHKNPKAFSCSQCSRKFNTKYALRRHMKQHSLDKKRKVCGNTDEHAVDVPASKTLSLQTDPEESLRVLKSEPILIQEAPGAQVHDSQTAITVQVIGFMPYWDT